MPDEHSISCTLHVLEAILPPIISDTKPNKLLDSLLKKGRNTLLIVDIIDGLR